ncbi:WAT1-related protein-like protein [Salvia divinorum]|uniref:WAT1-related protein n=1 Tax=Salvia divinorum TaxID=28513 RepID=A0ABD1FH51_SALDI
MEAKGCLSNFFVKAKPYIPMTSLQFGYARINIITRVSLNRSMSHYVLMVYRQAFSTAAIAPFALLLERKVRPKISFTIFCQLFVLGLLGPVIDQNLYYVGLKFTSPTFSCSMSNMLPAMTFIIAVIFIMEKLDMKKLRFQAKVAGTIVIVAGALLMTHYKGHIVKMQWSDYIHPSNSNDALVAAAVDEDKDWIKGSILLIIVTFT